MDAIVNKVASSGIVTINLEDYYLPGLRLKFDIADVLYKGLILREKDFREFVKEKDWSEYQDCYVALTCSADAIVPTWAYMLLTTKLEPFAKKVVFRDLETLETILFQEALSKVDIGIYEGVRVVVKGCGELDVPKSAYVTITEMLRPVAKSIMYGEPCSTVPLYKAPKK